jgi:sirohydrochlorin ferrochelatase
MSELTITLPAELAEKLRRHIPDKPPDQAVLDLVAQALAQEEEDQPVSNEEWLQQQRERFWQSSLGQYIHAQAEQDRSRGITLEQVQQMLAHDKSSWAAEVIADREDRL